MSDSEMSDISEVDIEESDDFETTPKKVKWYDLAFRILDNYFNSESMLTKIIIITESTSQGCSKKTCG